MNAILERLQALKIADVMNSRVVSVRAWQPMLELATLFHDREITSAPVVDEQGKCVGVLSATDFLLRDASCDPIDAPGAHRCACHVVSIAPDEPISVSRPADDTAGSWMTAEVISIAPNESLEKAARLLCREHVHRLMVLDEGGRVCGVISTMDIVAAVVNAVDETKLACELARL